MKITSIDLTPVTIPFREAETWFWGQRRGISNVIVRLHTDNGLIGLGEAVGFPSAPVVLEALTGITPFLEGKVPTMSSPSRAFSTHAAAGTTTATWGMGRSRASRWRCGT